MLVYGVVATRRHPPRPARPIHCSLGLLLILRGRVVVVEFRIRRKKVELDLKELAKTAGHTEQKGRPFLFKQLLNGSTHAHPVKIDLNKKLDHKQKTIQAFNIDA